MYVCTHVYVLYTHITHTHIHKHIHKLGDLGPETKCPGASWAVCRLLPAGQRRYHRQLWYRGAESRPRPCLEDICVPHLAPCSLQLLQLSSAPPQPASPEVHVPVAQGMAAITHMTGVTG